MWSRRAFLAAGGVSAPAWIRAQARRTRPHILLLMSDQHRGDCLGADGNRAIRTPNLDRLAREGVRFRHGYSCTPTCTPARAALLSGLGPWRNGMLGYSRVPETYPLEMPRALREAGYYTTGIGKMHWHPQRNFHGFHQVLLDESKRAETPEFRSDYRAWFYAQAPLSDPDATGLTFNDYRARPYVLPERLHPTRWTGDCAVRFLENYERAEPFFLKVSFARPHSPYDPPPRLFGLYRDAEIPAASVGAWAARYQPRSDGSNDIWHGDMGADVVRHSRQGYYGSVTFIDEEIGRILGALEQRGMLDETLIVYVSDHGDMTGDHHLWRKSYAYEASARIPFLVRWPSGLAPADFRGTVATQPVELRDLLPTFLDAAGARGAETLDGRSLLPLLRGRTEGWREFIDLEHDVCYSVENHWSALTDGRIKYIFHARSGEEQLFDLERDPGELRDLAGDQASTPVLRAWRQRLIAHLEPRGQQWVRGGKLQLRPESMLFSPSYPASLRPRPRPSRT